MPFSELDPWIHWALLALGVFAASVLAHRVLRPIARRAASWSAVLLAVVHRGDRAMQWVMPLVALQLLWEGLPDDLAGASAVQHTNGLLLIGALTALGMAAVRGVADGVLARHPDTVANNLTARRVHTQTKVLSRIASGTVLVTGIAFMLMSFPRARQFGASMLASAGVAGLVIGLAAKSVVGNMLAGLQIALAQPIRIDDVLIVEGEWGRVEEITATYVVLRIWDDRRMIIPLGWFIEHPFQNWTRTSADLLGTVFLWVDFGVALDELRAEAQRICEASKRWDRRVCLVQVTDANEKAMQLRVLVSSADSGAAFDLRCEVREGLIDFLRRHHPAALPRLRAEWTAPPGP